MKTKELFKNNMFFFCLGGGFILLSGEKSTWNIESIWNGLISEIVLNEIFLFTAGLELKWQNFCILHLLWMEFFRQLYFPRTFHQSCVLMFWIPSPERQYLTCVLLLGEKQLTLHHSWEIRWVSNLCICMKSANVLYRHPGAKIFPFTLHQ